MRTTRWTSCLVTAVAMVAIAGCDGGGAAVVGAPTPSVLGHPAPRTIGLAGLPDYLRPTGVTPGPAFRLPAGTERTSYSAAAGAPVAGLVWVRQPVDPFGLPGGVVELRPGLLNDGTRLLVTDDTATDAAHLRAWSPSGDSDYLLVYGGDAAARRSVLESIVAATFG
ncbi:hypothetical protein DFJ67_4984 [Asanoa ferruginea]|uniref:DUF4245 family protein n=1 Tax=Asanoa ferruginea TaxID=53367 RepID=A0A3D9ZQ07_9ACTN|nr:hypothetical protein [Asanoa ferruginea]REF98959.1 hypothetical protein DFJ67_4984 [Asanoa ferruginea]GIF46359.1 hypothetical protein Afe04nite_08980 [Asanoa ferruginea]